MIFISTLRPIPSVDICNALLYEINKYNFVMLHDNVKLYKAGCMAWGVGSVVLLHVNLLARNIKCDNY